MLVGYIYARKRGGAGREGPLVPEGALLLGRRSGALRGEGPRAGQEAMRVRGILAA